MPASRIFRFARTIRWARVASGTRNARAISGVVRPPRVRRVRATRASSASAGWQQVKTSRSRSSARRLSLPRRTIDSVPAATRPRSSSASFSTWRRARRTRSSARLRAVVVIQAPGLAGIPSRGHVSSAATNASATASSAASKSPPRRRMRVASARPDSSRNVRSMRATMAAGSTPVTAGAAVVARPGAARRRRLPRPPGSAPPRSDRSARAGRGRHLDDRADLDRAVERARAAGRRLEGQVDVVGLDDVVAAEDLLRLGERPVGRQASGRRARGRSSPTSSGRAARRPGGCPSPGASPCTRTRGSCPPSAARPRRSAPARDRRSGACTASGASTSSWWAAVPPLHEDDELPRPESTGLSPRAPGHVGW